MLCQYSLSFSVFLCLSLSLSLSLSLTLSLSLCLSLSLSLSHCLSLTVSLYLSLSRSLSLALSLSLSHSLSPSLSLSLSLSPSLSLALSLSHSLSSSHSLSLTFSPLSHSHSLSLSLSLSLSHTLSLSLLPFLPSQGRWAWGLEEPSQLEKDLAPRDTPSHWLARTIILTLLSWSLLILNTLALTIVPLMTGRALFSVAQVPLWIQHDPISYITGLCACFMAVSLCQTIIAMTSSLKKLNTIKKSVFKMPRGAQFKRTYLFFKKTIYFFLHISRL